MFSNQNPLQPYPHHFLGSFCGDKVTVYMFYKNALLVLPQFFFAFLSLSSGQNFYYDILYQSYNVLFTGFPIIALGVLDQASK